MKLQTKDQLIFLALLMCLLAPIAWGATWLVQKHQWAQGRLAEIEPRYAISSQVLAAKTDKAFDQIPLVIRAEGDFLALQSALAVLSSQAPLVLITEMDVQVQGGLINIIPTLAPRLSVQFNLSVLKERS